MNSNNISIFLLFGLSICEFAIARPKNDKIYDLVFANEPIDQVLDPIKTLNLLEEIKTQFKSEKNDKFSGDEIKLVEALLEESKPIDESNSDQCQNSFKPIAFEVENFANIKSYLSFYRESRALACFSHQLKEILSKNPELEHFDNQLIDAISFVAPNPVYPFPNEILAKAISLLLETELDDVKSLIKSGGHVGKSIFEGDFDGLLGELCGGIYTKLGSIVEILSEEKSNNSQMSEFELELFLNVKICNNIKKNFDLIRKLTFESLVETFSKTKENE